MARITMTVILTISIAFAGCSSKKEKKQKKRKRTEIERVEKPVKGKTVAKSIPKKGPAVVPAKKAALPEKPAVIAGAVAAECEKAAKTFTQIQEKITGKGKISGTQVLVKCPANCTDGKVWGTDFYTGDSAVCPAMVHAGIINAKEGGYALVTFEKGMQLYRAANRNGVTSNPYNSWELSFYGQAVDALGKPVGTKPVFPSGKVLLADCSHTVAALSENNKTGTSVVWDCPEKCEGGSVWGTGVYTTDSNVCSTAVHAGIIKKGKGGQFSVTILKGKKQYKGSVKNGVTSSDFGEYEKSFRVEPLRK